MGLINCEEFSAFEKNQDKKMDLVRGFYKNSSEHLQEELVRIGALIQLFLERTLSEAGKNNQDFLGMFVLEAEAKSILQAICCGSEVFRAQELKSEEIEAYERTISRKKAESLKRGIDLRLHNLSELFSLKPFETDVLLIGLAP